MISRPLLFCVATALVAGICLGGNTSALAQASKPKPAAPSKPSAAREQGGKPVDIGPPEDPVVAALLASNPKTPSEIFHTAQLLLGAGRPELAKTYLKKLLDAKLDDSQWSALVDQYHTAAFTDLAERSDLRPENDQVLRAVLSAVDRHLHDPARLAEEIKQLQDSSPEVRAAAIKKLQRAHATAAEALIAALADPQRAAEHAAVRHALAAMRSDAIAPLVSLLPSADATLAIEAVQALAEMRTAHAVVYLYAPALADTSDAKLRDAARAAIRQLQGSLPTLAQASRQLDELARSYFEGKQSLSTDVHGRATLWTWDDAGKKLVARSCSPDDAVRVYAARLAHAAQLLSPTNGAAQMLSIATELEEIVYARGLEKKLDFNDARVKRLAAIDPRIIDAVLAFCLKERHPVAARAAAEILGRSDKAQTLLQGGAGPSPLVRAVRSPDARLRVAALEAITALQPKSPFPGSSFVLEALVFQAGSTGGRRALAVTPNSHTLEEWTGVLKIRNIETDTAITGHEAVRMAWRCPDYELAVIGMATQRPPAEEIVQQLHRDYRTADLRIALVAPAGFLSRAQRIAESDPLAVAFSKPTDAAAARGEFARLNALVPREFVGFSERQELAARALDCLAKLAQTSGRVIDVQQAESAALAGLLVPRLSSHAVAVLADIGTRASQEALVDVASRAVNPLRLRQAAGAAFNLNVQQFGLLLSQESIRRQYRRYQQSAAEEAPAQSVLAAILTTIESRATPTMLEAARKASVPQKAPQPKKRIAN